jgi:3-hydroxyacyl-CoA dehydrogenase
MLFASGGHHVRLYDVIPEALQAAPIEIKKNLQTLEKDGQLKNGDKLNAEKQFSLISGSISVYRLSKCFH